jgi:hypothetical protein
MENKRVVPMENKRVVLASRPTGWVTEGNFRVESAPDFKRQSNHPHDALLP